MSKIARLAVDQVSNAAKETIEYSLPYAVTVRLEGSSTLLFHRWNVESVDAKATAAKGSKAKKTDDVESYVWRNDKGELCIPGYYLRSSIINAAKYRQDPRSPRKSAMDLYRAAIVSLTELATLGKREWDYLDRQRVQVQRNAINRTRPAMLAGWQAQFELMVNLPEYIDPNALRETIEAAGRLCGLADARPSYGRFGIVAFKVL